MRSETGNPHRRPLMFGRVTRVLFGVASFVVIAVVGPDTLGAVATVLMAFLGVSFIVGGLIGNPGCEITAVPNLLLPQSKRLHCH